MSNLAEKLARKGSASARGNSQVRLSLKHVSIFAVARVSFLVGVVIGIIGIIALCLGYAVLHSTGGLAQLDTLVDGVTGKTNTGTVTSILTFGRVFAVSALLAVLDIIFTTIGGIIAALLYNLSVRFTGGLLVGFANN
jgi:ABC-type sugar transport system permease subunit